MSTPLTDDFSVEDLTQSHHGIHNDCPPELASNLIRTAQKLEQAEAILSKSAGKPCKLKLTYGYRCKAENIACGSTANPSAHEWALASDSIPDPSIYNLREAWDILKLDFHFMCDMDQFIIERGCLHMGLAVPWHNNQPRHELRLDQTILESDGTTRRIYPLYGYWTPNGIQRV